MLREEETWKWPKSGYVTVEKLHESGSVKVTVSRVNSLFSSKKSPMLLKKFALQNFDYFLF